MILFFFLFPLSIFLDFMISYYVPFFPPIFSYFQPKLFAMTVILFLLCNPNSKKKYILWLGLMVYDFLFQPVYFSLLLFLIIESFVFFFQKYFSVNFFSYGIFLSSCILFIPLFQYFLWMGVKNFLPVSFLFTQMKTNFLFNFLYGICFYPFLSIKRKKVS